MSLLCQHCHTADLIPPQNQHPSYLICPNCNAIELVYNPMEHQDAFHATPYLPNDDPRTHETWPVLMQIVGVFGGYGSAKSHASLQEMLIRCLENPNGTGLFCAPTLPQLRKTTMKTWFNEICPPPLIQSFNKSELELKMINGFTWYFIPTDDEEKMRSINAGLVHMEEGSGIKRSIYDQLNTRMRDRFTHNRMIIVCSNPDLGWIKEVLVDNARRESPIHPEHEDYNPQITAYTWPTKLNTYLPPDFIANLRRGRPDWWQKRYLDGSFEHSEGMVYPNVTGTFRISTDYFSERFPDRPAMDVRLPSAGGQVDQIPTHWERFVTLDHGLRNPTAVYFHAIDPDRGQVITYFEYYIAGKLVPDHAKALLPRVQSIPAGRLRFMVADPSIRNKTDPIKGKSVQGLYSEYGLFFQEGNNSIEAGVLRVNSYIERQRWIILTDLTPELSKEIIGYKFPELSMDDDKNPDEKPVKYKDHACDSVRYGFMQLPDDPDLLLAPAYEMPNKYKQKQRDEDDDEYDDFEDGKDWLSYV